MTQPESKKPIEEQKPTSKVFNADAYAWRDHIKTAVTDLALKIPEIDLDWKYYDGDHPRIWVTDTLRDMFENEFVENMSENWCEVAVEAPVKRLGIDGWTSSAEGVEGVSPEDGTTAKNTVHTKGAANVFKDNDLDLDQKEIYRQARAVGECFAFVWKDDEKEFGIDIAINDARNVWWPKNCHRNDPTRVVKVWMDEDEGIWRATCYYRYVVVRLKGPKINESQAIPQARYFEVDSDDPGGIHGFEKVPVIRFALQRKRKGILASIKHNQDKINKLAAGKIVAAEFNAFGKTFILSKQNIEDGTLKFYPDRATILDPGGGDEGAPTSIWESSALDLENYDKSIGTEIDKLFTIAGLPGHMQVRGTGKAVPSGAAYEADEGPFTEMVADMHEAFGASWTDLMALCDLDVKPQWKNPRIKSEIDESTTVKTYKDAGMPLALALKYYASGWDDERLKELMDAPLSPDETQSLAMAKAMTDIDATGQGAPPNAQSGEQPPRPNSGTGGQVPKGFGK